MLPAPLEIAVCINRFCVWRRAAAETEVMRIFRFVIALRTLVRSIMHTLKALIWAMLLLTLIVYVFAVLFTQIVDGAEKDLGVDAPEMANSTRYFGSLPQTMLSLFMSITGGVSWEAVIEPLTFISPVWSLVFLFYISFIYFAVLNVVHWMQQANFSFSGCFSFAKSGTHAHIYRGLAHICINF